MLLCKKFEKVTPNELKYDPGCVFVGASTHALLVHAWLPTYQYVDLLAVRCAS